jgi:hypothetical protein
VRELTRDEQNDPEYLLRMALHWRRDRDKARRQRDKWKRKAERLARRLEKASQP